MVTRVMTITHDGEYRLPFFQNCVTIAVEDKAMKPYIELHLQGDSDKAEATNRPEPEQHLEPEHEEPRSQIHSKHLSKFLNRTAHRAIVHTGRGGVISK
jgi:hypothetical protein